MGLNVKKIMVVDDEAISNMINRKMLQKYNGQYEIVDYTNPELAFASLAEQKPDVLFLDLNMPLMTGWEFLDAMHAAGNITPVVILTSSTSNADLERSKNYNNVVHYKSKPLNLAVIGQILGE